MILEDKILLLGAFSILAGIVFIAYASISYEN
mgnify:CR=1 FL=1